MKSVLGWAVLAAGAAAAATQAQATDDTIKIGVLTDLSGLYAAPTGPGSVFAARQAVADFLAAHTAARSRWSPATTRTSPT
jgi:branched-chain amino acid transport system substrate-binding protein